MDRYQTPSMEHTVAIRYQSRCIVETRIVTAPPTAEACVVWSVEVVGCAACTRVTRYVNPCSVLSVRWPQAGVVGLFIVQILSSQRRLGLHCTVCAHRGASHHTRHATAHRHRVPSPRPDCPPRTESASGELATRSLCFALARTSILPLTVTHTRHYRGTIRARRIIIYIF